jgi:2-methylcitrate dehydratase PrpD
MSTVCERLGAFAVAPPAIPARVLDKARAQTVSVLASMHAGARVPAVQVVRRALARRPHAGPCTVIPTGERLSLADAVTVNSAASMALDYDDYLYMGHTGHSAVLGSLAVAEEEGRSSNDVLLAQVVANEVAGRLGASAVLGPQNGQAWSFIHAAAGAVLGARLLGLTRTEAAHAIAIALYQPPFTLWPGFLGGDCKVLTAAAPTVTGIQAAAMAREGMTGALDIVESPGRGFWAQFTYAPLPRMLGGLGERWVTDTLAVKRYPGCAYIDTTMDALFATLADAGRALGRPVRPDEVRGIEVAASLLTVEMDELSGAHATGLTPVSVNFSIPLNVAIAVVAGRLTGREMEPRFLAENEPLLRTLAGRVTLTHSWEMTADVARSFAHGLGALSWREALRVLGGYRSQRLGPRRNPLGLAALLRQPALARTIARGAGGDGLEPESFRMSFPAQVTLRLDGERMFQARQDVPHGAPGGGGPGPAAREKWANEVRLPDGRTERALEMLERFEEHPLPAIIQTVCG